MMSITSETLKSGFSYFSPWAEKTKDAFRKFEKIDSKAVKARIILATIAVGLATIFLLPFTFSGGFAIFRYLVENHRINPTDLSSTTLNNGVQENVGEPEGGFREKVIEVSSDEESSSSVENEGTEPGQSTVDMPILSEGDLRQLLDKPSGKIPERIGIPAQRLVNMMSKLLPKMKLSKTVYNNDGFFDAFVQAYNAIGGEQISIKEARKIVSEFKGNAEFNIENIQEILKLKFIDWGVCIKDDFQTASSEKSPHLGGGMEIEGRILATHFNVNIRFISEGLHIEESENALLVGYTGLDDVNNRKFDDKTTDWLADNTKPIVVIAEIPGRFFAVVPE